MFNLIRIIQQKNTSKTNPNIVLMMKKELDFIKTEK